MGIFGVATEQITQEFREAFEELIDDEAPY